MKRARSPEDSPSFPPETGPVAFRLYLAAGAPSSETALANLTRICRQYYRSRYTIEKIDILHEPLRALGDGVLLTPTLVRVSPPPSRVIVGDLSDTGVLLQALGLHQPHPGESWP